MALSTTADYKTALYEVLYAVENSVGLDPQSFVRRFGIMSGNEVQIMQEYAAYKGTIASRIAHVVHNIS